VAFALGFAGGFADAGVEPEPQPVVSGRGSGSPLFRTRWVPRPGQPALPPVRLTVSVHVGYRCSATVTRIAPKVRLVQAAPRLSFRVTALTTYVRARGFAAKTTAKVVKVDVDPIAVSRFAYEVRELTEVAVALTAWQ
jgi:hypothetical protein